MEWFCLNVKFRVLQFLIFQILQMPKLSFFCSTNFAIDFLFVSGLPPLASNCELKKILKSPAKIMRLFWLISNFFNRPWSSSKIFTCSASVVSLCRFIRIYWSVSGVIQRIEILPVILVSIYWGQKTLYQDKQLEHCMS